MADETVEPVLVDSETAFSSGSGKVAHKARYDAYDGLFLEQPYLKLEPSRVRDVVGVHPRHQGRSAPLETPVESGDEARRFLVNDLKALIGGHASVEDCCGPVDRPVVHHDYFEVAECLSGKAPEALLKPSVAVSDRHQHGDRRHGHREGSLSRFPQGDGTGAQARDDPSWKSSG
jgi:hypothetical protein